MAGDGPKYRRIADHLMQEISKGRHAVGDLLPTESELMRAYGVSRHTIRTAVQDLKSRGAVASRQGQGSTVISASDRSSLIETIQSIDELIAFGKETRREFLSSEVIEADDALCGLLGCQPGRRFVKVLMLRKSAGTGAMPIAHVTLLLDLVLEQVVDALGQEQKSAAEIIHEDFGIKTVSVVQTIEATSLDAAQATVLGAQQGDPALTIRRDYFAATDKEPFLIARSVCRAGAFKVVSRFSAPT